jgi:hypothetical protein
MESLSSLKIGRLPHYSLTQCKLLMDGVVNTGTEFQSCIGCERDTCVLCQKKLPNSVYTFPESRQSFATLFRNLKTDADYFKNVRTIRDDADCPIMQTTFGYKVCEECPEPPLSTESPHGADASASADSAGILFLIFVCCML